MFILINGKSANFSFPPKVSKTYRSNRHIWFKHSFYVNVYEIAGTWMELLLVNILLSEYRVLWIYRKLKGSEMHITGKNIQSKWITVFATIFAKRHKYLISFVFSVRYVSKNVTLHKHSPSNCNIYSALPASSNKHTKHPKKISTL